MNARLSFDAELESLSASLIRMGALATDAIDKAIEALEANDGALAQSVIAGDRNIDDMERSIEHQCLTLLLRQQLCILRVQLQQLFHLSELLLRAADLLIDAAQRFGQRCGIPADLYGDPLDASCHLFSRLLHMKKAPCPGAFSLFSLFLALSFQIPIFV